VTAGIPPQRLKSRFPFSEWFLESKGGFKLSNVHVVLDGRAMTPKMSSQDERLNLHWFDTITQSRCLILEHQTSTRTGLVQLDAPPALWQRLEFPRLNNQVAAP
jgi:hypothetical protein